MCVLSGPFYSNRKWPTKIICLTRLANIATEVLQAWNDGDNLALY